MVSYSTTDTILPPGQKRAESMTRFVIEGMTCNNCARHVTEAIQQVAGVASATVSLNQSSAMVRWLPETHIDAAAVIGAVRHAGFEAQVADQATASARPSSWSPLTGWKFNVVLGGCALLLLLAAEWRQQRGAAPWFPWVSAMLSLPVQVLCGARFYRGAWNQLKMGRSNMDTLVVLGSSSAFGFSAWVLLSGQQTHLYFMESAAIITLISVGHWLEAITSSKAADALESLLHLAPSTARRMNAAGRTTEVPAAALECNDRVMLMPGDRVPTDGLVQEGDASVDESMLTGESLPLDKTTGDLLYAGTINRNGRLVMRVTATGEATALAQIIAVVARAQSSRANIQRLGDKISNIFVPMVVAIALAAGVWWGLAFEYACHIQAMLGPFLWVPHPPESAWAAAFIHAAGVLIVACPCAMGLATPVAIMVGTNVAARRGILIRDGMALEKTGRITVVVFDKTGTLTFGKPTVAGLLDLHSLDSNLPSMTTLAASMARTSNHPLSQAIARLSPSSIPWLEWEEKSGAGIIARFTPGEGQPPIVIRLGSLRWLKENEVDLAAGSSFLQEWSSQGASLIGLAGDRRLLGLLALRDTLKPDADKVISRLLADGKKAFLITGDNALTAAAIARQAGIGADRVFAEIRPTQKAEIIRQLQDRGERVAFIGDGINDAPALEQADLGIAVSQASDVAREAADIILLNSDIQAIPEALGLARATLRTIKQNLFWAFFYNAAAVPLAALGFLSPVLCAAAMGLSDLVVIGNALRLRRWKGQGNQ